MADADVGKLFVGGISRETTEDSLKDHFSKYGDVTMTMIAKDRVTNTPRGFGFVTFFDSSSVDLAVRDHHVISGRTVEVKKAIPRNGTNSQRDQLQQQNHQQFYQNYFPHGGPDLSRTSNGSYGCKKIFVGGLSANLTEDEFKSYFEKFGRITDVVVMHDNNTNRPRGFGFITFDSEQVVETIMQKTHHELAGKRVDVKRAVPRNNGNGSRYDGGRFSPRYGNYTFQAPIATTTTNPELYYNGVYHGGFPFGGYGFYGYGMPMVFPHGPWNGFGTTGVGPFAYGTGYYPSTMNGGVAVMGMVNPYDGFMEPSQDFNDNNGDASRKEVLNGEKDSRSRDSQARVKVAAPVVAVVAQSS